MTGAAAHVVQQPGASVTAPARFKASPCVQRSRFQVLSSRGCGQPFKATRPKSAALPGPSCRVVALEQRQAALELVKLERRSNLRGPKADTQLTGRSFGRTWAALPALGSGLLMTCST